MSFETATNNNHGMKRATTDSALRPNLDCDCCGGEGCCDDATCFSICFCATDLALTIGAGSPIVIPDICVTGYVPTGLYLHNSVIELDENTWVELRIWITTTCFDGGPLDINFYFQARLIHYINSEWRYFGEAGMTTVASLSDVETCEDELNDLTLASVWGPSFFNHSPLSSLASIEGQYTIGPGECASHASGCCSDVTTFCAGTPSYFCCDGGAWFGSPAVPPTPLTGTCISGPLTGATITLGAAVIRSGWQGECVLYYMTGVTNTEAEIYIHCDGSVAGWVEVSPTVTYPPFNGLILQEIQAVGSVTAVNSTSPLDFEVTFTAGYLSGNVFQFVE